jgi:mannosyltransferase OCH1-like enzyme
LIPRLVHRIWLGPEPMPEEYVRLGKTWKRNHPGWEHHLWGETNLPPDLSPEVHELLRRPAERADILRLELLHRLGGVYVDADVESLQPIDPLLEGVTCFLGALDSGRVSNAIMGGVPGHPLFARALAQLRPRTTFGPVDREGTGPLLIERIRHDFPDVTVFEPEVFYATERDRAQYTFHFSARSWKDEAGLRADLARAERDRSHARDELRRVRRQHELAVAELEALRRGHGLRAAALRFRQVLRRRD